MSSANSPVVELAPLREMLRMYCRALSERSVELQDLRQLVEKNIGWSRDDVATSDGAAIFLPAAIERFESQAQNFEFLKVMLTQQAGHIEFGSFEFQFDRPSTRFPDLRPRLSSQPDDPGHYHDHPTPTELTRFFRLFPNKRLAPDTFAIVESARIEARVIHEYPGIAPLYRVMRERVLAVRQEMVLLPAREALLELLIRVSLGQSGAFKPELAQLWSKPRSNAREQRKSLTPEELAELLKSRDSPKPRDSEEEREEQDPQIERMVQNLMRELERRDRRMQSGQQRPWFQSDDDAGSLTANQADTFIYDEWDEAAGGYRSRWCKLYEKVMPAGDLNFYRDTLLNYAGLARQIRREFELAAPELHHKEKRLPDGSDHDLDAAIEAMVDLRIGVSPSEKIFWRNHKAERDVAVAFLLDMSGSTGEALGRAPAALQSAGSLGDHDRAPRRIIDVEKEAIVLMIDALATIGDRYVVFGFSGHGRDNVEFFVIKDIDEEFSPEVAKRIGRAGPLHATRMGPVIRHATSKLGRQQTRSKFLFLISDGRPP